MSDHNPDDVTSMQHAAENAGYPTTSGDLDAEQPTADAEVDAALQTVASAREYLSDPNLTDEQRTARADAIERAEASREGGPRQGVTDAIAGTRTTG